MDTEKKTVTVEERDEDKRRLSVFGGKSLTRSMAFSGISTTSRMRVRKQSYGFSSVSGIRNAERMAMAGIEYKRPILTYLNTYQLDPYVRFNPVQVTKAIDAILDELFTEKHKYHLHESPALAIRISAELLRTIKNMHFNRYRILSIVSIIQRRAQSYVNAVAFLWDHERDNYVNVQRNELTCFIQVTIFGVYLD